jgi:hypothetical protein
MMEDQPGDGDCPYQLHVIKQGMWEKVPEMDWPIQSPDQNPTEQLSDVLEQRWLL